MFKFDEPFGHAIFCDDIRSEIGGKTSFIGSYPAGLQIPSFPLAIAKFGIAATFYEPAEMAARRDWGVPVKVFAPGNDEPVMSGEFPPIPKEVFDAMRDSTLPKDPEVPELITMQMGFVFTPLELRAPGRLKVRAFYKDEIIKIGSLRVELAPPSTASSGS